MKSLMSIILCFVVFLIFTSHYVFACLLYLFGGFLWMFYEKQLPATYKSIGVVTASGRMFLYFFWPLRLIYLLRDFISNERYIVVTDSEKREIKYFGNWAKAREYAINKAREENKTVAIHDQAQLVRMRFGGLWMKTWDVFPNGKIARSPLF